MSARENTLEQPEKNNCRDICAPRVRAAIEGGPGRPEGLGGEFGYLIAKTIHPSDVPFDLTPELIWTTLCLLHGGVVTKMPDGRIKRVPSSDETRVVYCTDLDDEILQQLSDHASGQLIVYTDRPTAVREAISHNRSCDVRSVLESVLTANLAVGDE